MKRGALVCLLACFCLGGVSQGHEPPSAGPDPRRHALLVGVTKYQNLPERQHLRGPSGDVAMLAGLLTQRLRFPAGQVQELTEEGGQKSPANLPTRPNIDQAIQKLIARCKRGDQVLLYLAGHGSQQPASADSLRDEADGLDEVFLPRDVGTWDKAKKQLPGAFVDNEIQTWVAKLRDKGASVCLIIDTCHSGTMLRGPSETVRRVAPVELNIPAEELAAARQAALALHPANRTRGGLAHDESWQLAPGAGVVAIYACRPDEVTVEERLPRRSAGAQPHGLFSYTLCQALTQALDNRSQPLTYRELLGKVRRRYAELGRDAPNPVLEGTDLDRELFGDRVWPGRSTLQLLGEGRVNAGAIQGLSEGSILAVYAAEAPQRLLGHVRVKRALALESEVEPCEYAGVPLATELPVDSVCRPVRIDLGPMQLRVAVDERESGDAAPAQPIQDQVRGALQAVAASKPSPIELVADAASADWFVRLRQQDLVLTPAARWDGPQRFSAAFGPFAYDQDLAKTLRDRFTRIVQATNLVRLALSSADGTPSSAEALRLQVGVQLHAAGDESAKRPLPLQDGLLHVYQGDELSVELTNDGGFPVDVSILFVDSEFGITSLFPQEGEDNRLLPGQRRSIDDLTVDVQTVGREFVVVIGVRGDSPERVDLSILAQSGVEAATRAAGLNSELGRLLANRLYGVGQTRGESRTALGGYTLNAIPWEAIAQPRPQP